MNTKSTSLKITAVRMVVGLALSNIGCSNQFAFSSADSGASTKGVVLVEEVVPEDSEDSSSMAESSREEDAEVEYSYEEENEDYSEDYEEAPTVDDVYADYGCGRESNGQRKFLVCHHNHGNKGSKTLCLPEAALSAHVGKHHDRAGEKDYFGECGAENDNEDDDDSADDEVVDDSADGDA